MRLLSLGLLLLGSCANSTVDTVDAVNCGIIGPEDGVDGPGPFTFYGRSLPDGQVPDVTIRDGTGPVVGEWVAHGNTGRRFKPAEYLTPSTTYSWSENTNCGDSGEFTTSGVGAPVADPQAVIGETFAGAVCGYQDCRDQATAWWIGEDGGPFHVRIDALDPQTDRVELTLAQVGSLGRRNTCAQTTTHVGIWRNDAYIAVSGDQLSIVFDGGGVHQGQGSFLPTKPGADLHIWDWELVFALIDAPARVQLVMISGLFDTRHYTDDFAAVTCTDIHDSCEPCPDGVNACVTHSFPAVQGPDVPPLVEVGWDQRENHLCWGSCDNGLDDDDDGVTDDDIECDWHEWPTSRW